MKGRTAVALLSGGLDSSTVAAIAQSQGFEITALTLLYGQRHEVELAAAKRVVAALGIQNHLVFPLPDEAFQGSALTSDIPVPKISPLLGSPRRGLGVESPEISLEPSIPGESPLLDSPMRGLGEESAEESQIPVTYVPARNTVFLSLALAVAESIGSHDIFIGVSSVDYSGYPDCRPEFIESFQQTARLATKIGVEGAQITIHAPLLHLSKAATIEKGIELGVDYALTHSCYDPENGQACGRCDSCQIRKKAFESLGLTDPALGDRT